MYRVCWLGFENSVSFQGSTDFLLIQFGLAAFTYNESTKSYV